MKKKKKWKPLIIIAVIVVVLVIVILLGSKKDANGLLTLKQEAAAKHDIQTYHSFTGTIVPTDEQEIKSEVTGVKITEILVDKGQEVKKGDVLMILDKDSVQNQIDELETSMGVSSRSNAIAISEATRKLNNFNSDVDNNLNAQLVQATQQVDNAYISLQNAQKEYNNEINLNEKGWSQNIMPAINQVETSYQSMLSAENSYYQTKENDLSTDRQKDSSKIAYDTAILNYQNSLVSYEAAKVNEDNKIVSLYDGLLTAQNNYFNAVDNYNVTVNSINETRQDYETAVDRAYVQADQSVNELKLEQLYQDLEDCVITAPCDGTITALDANEGDVILNTTVLCKITNFDVMKIEIKINEYDIIDSGIGSPVSVYVDALDREFDGEITYIDRVATVENGVSYFKSEVSFTTDEDVRSGMSVEIKLTTNDLKGVLAIPSDAVKARDDGTPYVLVMGKDGKTTEERDIEGGVTDGKYTQILSGIEEGETVYYEPVIDDYMMMMGHPGSGEK